MAEAAESEIARDLLDVGNMLLSPPSDVEDLLKLLSLAEDFLSQVQQAPPMSMNLALYRIMKALTVKDFLNHFDMDIKVTLASCFSEIIYITAPVDPYNEVLMKDIFRLIVDALKNIDDLSSRTYYKKLSILETIAKVHSCVLMLNLDCDDLIIEMFQQFLKTIRPDNEGRVFSFMETIMTDLLNDCGDQLLPGLLDSLLKDIEDGSPIACRLREKVIRNCAGRLKPYLTKIVHSNDTYSNGYGDIIASIYQESRDTSELNLPSTSGECLESGRLEPVVDCLKDMDTPTDKSTTMVLNGTVQRGSCDSVIWSSSVRQNPESHYGIEQSDIATISGIAELDSLKSSRVVNSDDNVDCYIKKRRDQREKSALQLNNTTSHFQRHGDKDLSVPSRSRDCIKEANCQSSKGASYIDHEGEILASEDTRYQSIEENHGSVGITLRKSCKSNHSIGAGEINLADLSLEKADKTVKPIDSEAEKLCHTTTRRSSRKDVERKLLEQRIQKTKQQMQNTFLRKDLTGEKISMNCGQTELVDVSLKTTDETIDSEGKHLCRKSIWRSQKKATEMESSEHQKSVIKKLIGKLVIIDDLAGRQSSKALNKDQYNLEESSITKSRRKRTRAISEALNKDQYNLEESSITKSRRKRTRAISEVLNKDQYNLEESSITKSRRKHTSAISEVLNKDQYNLEESSITKSRRKRTSAISEAFEVETGKKELVEALVGSKIKVWWPADDEFYDGVVDSFEPVSKKHKIAYFDGDEEILFLKDECWEFLEDNTKPDFLWRQQIENPASEASSNVLNVVKGKNPMWEHCEKVAKWKYKCLHCSKIVSNVTRMKYHLARTGTKCVLPCTRASQEVEKLFRDMVSEIRPSKYVTGSNMVNGKDPTWEHCKRVGGDAKWKLKCIHCSKIVSGVTRMKYHLARANTISEPCTNCPRKVEKFFFDLINQLKPCKYDTLVGSLGTNFVHK